MKQLTSQPTLDLIPLRTAVSAIQSTTVDVLLRIIPPDFPDRERRKRPSFNLGFVIDHSGSMASHGKLDYARQAVCYAVEQLLPSDRLSVTIFDDHVEMLIPSTMANNKPSLTRRIQQIQPGGSTALHQGWLQGGIQVSQSLTSEMNRVILLSDGLANVGETNPDTIAQDVHGLAQRGVSTTTIGVGNDYDEDLLQAMSRSGDGNYYYIASPEQLPGIFERELQGLSQTIGREVTLAIEPLGQVVVADVLNDFPVNAVGQFQLPNLVAGNPIEVVLRLQVPAMTGDRADLCTFQVHWLDPQSEPLHLSATLHLAVVTQAVLEQLPLNAEVQGQVALMMAARAKKEAVQEVDRGNYDKAKQILQDSQAELRVCPAPMAATEVEMLSDLAGQLEQRQFASYRKSATHQVMRRQSSHSGGHTDLLYALAKGPQMGDITADHGVEAIVNSTDRLLSAASGVSAAIHRVAGSDLQTACHAIAPCEFGEAKITPGFALPTPWVIHTACPVWQGGTQGEADRLAQCYSACLQLAVAQKIRTIAFPVLGTGLLGFPLEVAAKVAFTTVSQFLLTNRAIAQVKFICADAKVHRACQDAFLRVAGW